MSAAPMKWSVSIRRKMSDAAHTFDLDVSFSSQATRLVLFGPSGAGKTLTLKAIAGLLRPDAGTISFEGETLFDAARGIDVPSRERRLGYVFQEYALFPHLTVRQNVSFGLGKGWRNPGRRGVNPAAERWLEALELGALGDRFPDQISGGQRQRTALARALAAEPRALLFDEPFAAMDLALRDKLRAELRAVQVRFALPMLLITHDAADVEAFADEVIHIDAGRVVQQAARPQESIVKTSARNQLAGTVRSVNPGAVNDEIELELAGGRRIVAIVTHDSAMSLGLVPGAAAFALVKASSVIVVADPGTARLSARNQLAGKVTRIQPGAVNAEVLIDVGGGLTIAAIVTQESASALGLAAGSPATAVFKASSVIVGVPS
jgi:molybdate transport system ATP-binding protein